MGEGRVATDHFFFFIGTIRLATRKEFAEISAKFETSWNQQKEWCPPVDQVRDHKSHPATKVECLQVSTSRPED